VSTVAKAKAGTPNPGDHGAANEPTGPPFADPVPPGSGMEPVELPPAEDFDESDMESIVQDLDGAPTFTDPIITPRGETP
jgi:hypothetical protein